MKRMLSDDNGTPSSMRASFILITIGVFLLFVATGIYVVMCAFHPEKLGEPSWEAIGIFLVGLASVVTGAGWNKVKQKQVEKNENK